MTAITVSFLVIILSVSISSGFRNELRNGISDLFGDVSVTAGNSGFTGSDTPVGIDEGEIAEIRNVSGVTSVIGAVYRAGIVKSGSNIQGVLFKGVTSSERDVSMLRHLGHKYFPAGLDSLGVSIPERLSKMIGLKVGDNFPAYFIGDNVKVRKFTVRSIYEGVLNSNDNLVVFADYRDLIRLNGWDDGQFSALEIDADSDDAAEISNEIGARVSNLPERLVATSSARRFPQIFSWLDLIDYNVLVILVLMVIVAGFNMISGLLIMLFRNISTIGTLKSMGMTDRGISGVFLRVSSRLVLKGMVIGNTLALAFCGLQHYTHFLKLDPENYFVSYVPVHVDLLKIAITDFVAYFAIMLLLLIPCLFVSRVDPAQTVRMR